jgi:hypothetical protein
MVRVLYSPQYSLCEGKGAYEIPEIWADPNDEHKLRS